MSHRAFDGYTAPQTANGVDGYGTTIRAQSATGTTAKGGNLILASGKGTSTDGYVIFQAGDTEVLRITRSGLANVTIDGYLHTTGNTTLDGYLHTVGNTTLDGYLHTLGNTTLDGYLHTVGNTTLDGYLHTKGYNLFDGYTRANSYITVDGYIKVDGYTTIDGYTITFDGYAQAPKISQSNAPEPGVDGHHLTIQAQSSTVSPAYGGNLILQSGDGYNGDGTIRDGTIKLIAGSKNIITLDGYNVSFFLDLGSFGGGKSVVFLANATVVPSSNPTGGGILYVENGDLKYKGPSGTITTIATA